MSLFSFICSTSIMHQFSSYPCTKFNLFLKGHCHEIFVLWVVELTNRYPNFFGSLILFQLFATGAVDTDGGAPWLTISLRFFEKMQNKPNVTVFLGFLGKMIHEITWNKKSRDIFPLRLTLNLRKTHTVVLFGEGVACGTLRTCLNVCSNRPFHC